jgi:hypothetical protein
MIGRASGGIAKLGPGVRGTHVLEGCGWPEVARRACHFVQSHRHASGRQWGGWLNGQGIRGGCASRVRGLSPARMREREGQKEGVRSRSGAYPNRRGRSGLGVAGRWWWTGEGVGSPGEHARCREGAAHACLVGVTEREWGARGELPRGLPEQGRREGDRVHPWGF